MGREEDCNTWSFLELEKVRWKFKSWILFWCNWRYPDKTYKSKRSNLWMFVSIYLQLFMRDGKGPQPYQVLDSSGKCWKWRSSLDCDLHGKVGCTHTRINNHLNNLRPIILTKINLIQDQAYWRQIKKVRYETPIKSEVGKF